MNNDNYLFLDIDGVLCVSAQHYSKKTNSYGESNFDTKCVKVLNEIKNNANFKTVLTSDWGLRHNIKTMNNIFEFNGLNITIDDYPTSLWGVKFFSLKDLEICRAEEILQYIKDHEIQNYVVVDDLDMTKWFGDRMVVCKRHNEGIKQTGIKDKILNILNSE
jgi:hypothetical protein